ncbi:MAG: NADH:flavin oxidoreductase [Synergistaceae bacterium]|jgi:2,4-dienoyl-CoA reductase-like NADH-dependent reductase (Old Yellow Enzyme family)|nr:NADH:flavin oxidoreductase [Synergistaceae bacterium]
MKTLFDATILNGLSLKNRFIRAAVGENTVDGAVNEHILGVYRKLSKGGAGTLITGFTLVDEAERLYPILALYDDDFIEGHKKLTELVHESGANIISQLVYVGSWVIGGKRGEVLLAPSAVKHLKSNAVPREASVTEIQTIQRKFAEAALRAKESGYDGVEIHAAHWFFLSQFLTPYYNRRADRYGGQVENRARMLVETYEAIRETVGANFPVWVKINVNDGFDMGVSLEDCLYVGRELSRRGIDAIEVSGDWMERAEDSSPFFKNEAEALAAEASASIILTGCNRDFQNMTEILNRTDIAYFGLARPLIKEPDLINRFFESVNSERAKGHAGPPANS